MSQEVADRHVAGILQLGIPAGDLGVLAELLLGMILFVHNLYQHGSGYHLLQGSSWISHVIRPVLHPPAKPGIAVVDGLDAVVLD